jgi:hypothetical protein
LKPTSKSVAQDAARPAVGAHDHGHGVPADDALDTALDLAAARKYRLALHRYGVDIGCGERALSADAVPVRLELETPQQIAHPLRPLGPVNIVQGFEPFPVFLLDLSGPVFASIGWDHRTAFISASGMCSAAAQGRTCPRPPPP